MQKDWVLQVKDALQTLGVDFGDKPAQDAKQVNDVFESTKFKIRQLCQLPPRLDQSLSGLHIHKFCCVCDQMQQPAKDPADPRLLQSQQPTGTAGPAAHTTLPHQLPPPQNIAVSHQGLPCSLTPGRQLSVPAHD